jgi:hypothetical protein
MKRRRGLNSGWDRSHAVALRGPRMGVKTSDEPFAPVKTAFAAAN